MISVERACVSVLSQMGAERRKARLDAAVEYRRADAGHEAGDQGGIGPDRDPDLPAGRLFERLPELRLELGSQRRRRGDLGLLDPSMPVDDPRRRLGDLPQKSEMAVVGEEAQKEPGPRAEACRLAQG